MDNPSFAEIKERFSKMNVNPYARPPTVPTMNNESSSLEPNKRERSNTESSNQSLDNSNPLASYATASSPQASDETSSSRDAISARIRQQGINSIPVLKKPPVPLPPQVSQPRNENTSSESSSISQGLALQRMLVFPTNVNTPTSLRKPPVPLPTSDQNENTYSELSSDLRDSTISSSTVENESDYVILPEPSTPLPNLINTDRREIVHSDSVFVSLDTMLPSKCMSLEFETIINDYQRKDPRTIIYPKTKPPMPKMTTNEINTLQRYSNT